MTASKGIRAKLREEHIPAIRAYLRDGEKIPHIAALYGVHRFTMNQFVTRYGLSRRTAPDHPNIIIRHRPTAVIEPSFIKPPSKARLMAGR